LGAGDGELGAAGRAYFFWNVNGYWFFIFFCGGCRVSEDGGVSLVVSIADAKRVFVPRQVSGWLHVGRTARFPGAAERGVAHALDIGEVQ